ncbi:MAG: GNAT family N-acetyltransferase [Phenylobacterium sp.]|uniref:GNAT family N-acetyltransferase n=1 Tax=Phenylobacterium sp. TaxID=1871053 RepID=UPI00391CC440
MKDLVIRRAAADEIPACAALYARVHRETFTWVRPDRLPTAQDFIADAAEEDVYLAATPAKLYGVAAFHAPSNFLHSLFVAERGQGIGKRLLDHVCAQADGPVTLKVQAPNLRAEAFYLREGFRALSRGEDPPPGFPWIRMVR